MTDKILNLAAATDDLDSHEYDVMQELVENDPHWVIHTPHEAERILRGVYQRKQRTEQLIDACNRQIDYYKMRADKFRAQFEHDTAWAYSQLDHYHRTLPIYPTKSGQTVFDLPSGKLIRKPQEPLFERDEYELLKWAKRSANPAYVSVKECPSWLAIKSDCAVTSDGLVIHCSTGEVVSGVKATPRPPVFDIKFDTSLTQSRTPSEVN